MPEAAAVLLSSFKLPIKCPYWINTFFRITAYVISSKLCDILRADKVLITPHPREADVRAVFTGYSPNIALYGEYWVNISLVPVQTWIGELLNCNMIFTGAVFTEGSQGERIVESIFFSWVAHFLHESA